MKKVKFRVRYLEEEERKAHRGKPTYWTPKNPSCSLSHVLMDDDYAVSEFTGLKDKNGKEIYSEDIVRGKNYNGKEIENPVIWNNDGWYVGYIKGETMCVDSLWSLSDVKITGNVFENKDLLTKV